MKILMREDKNDKWELVESNAYAAENELQELLASSPDVISMDEIRAGAGPLVAAVREFSLPVGYIDILAFTMRGDIAIVECKLARNTQAKREVIGQILDYAAHMWDMSYEELDQRIQSMTNRSLADYVHEQSNDPDWDEEIFRANIASALEQGNFILTIVVNEINEELNRIVRYVNAAGTPAFSFAALEMRRFHKSKIEMLVPHVFGPAHASAPKPKQTTRRWDEQAFFDALHMESPATEGIAKQILDWARAHKTRITWGEGTRYGSFVPLYNYGGQERPLFAVWTYGSVEVYFYWYQYRPPFDREEKRLEMLNKLNEIDGVRLPVDAINKRPSIKLSTFTVPEKLDEFFAVFEWMLEEINRSQAD
jgi:hypothetical protein